MPNTKQIFDKYKSPKGQELRYKLDFPTIDSDETPPVILLAHGFGGSLKSAYIQETAKLACDAGFVALSFDATPVGKGNIGITHDLTPSYMVKSIHSVLQEVDGKYSDRLDLGRLSLNGMSFGALGVTMYAAHHNGIAENKRLIKDPYPIQSVVLQSVVPEPMKPFEKYLNWPREQLWKRFRFTKQEIGGDKCAISYNLYKECKALDLYGDYAQHVTAPVFIQQGADDTLCDGDQFERLINSFSHQSPRVAHKIYIHTGHAFEDTRIANKWRQRDPEDIQIWIRNKGNIVDPSSKEHLIACYISENTEQMTFLPQAVQMGIGFIKDPMGFVLS
jgi:dienelactone hydrolase